MIDLLITIAILGPLVTLLWAYLFHKGRDMTGQDKVYVVFLTLLVSLSYIIVWITFFVNHVSVKIS